MGEDIPMNYTEIKDEKIIELFFARNEDAIAQASGKYSPYCTAIAARILADQSDVEECVSDTWLGAWNSIPPHMPKVLRTYLGRITRNLSLNRRRENRAEKRGADMVTVALDELSEITAGGESAESGIAAEELAASIDRYLAGLKPEQRKIFVMRYWYFLPLAEIAERLGVTDSKVKMMLKRTRDGLREKLLEEGYEI